MKHKDALDQLLHQLQEFKQKFYLNMLLRGSIFAVGLLLSIYIIYSLLEYIFYFPQLVRGFLLFSFVAFVVYVFARWIVLPIAALARLKRVLSDEQAADRVGAHYPEIRDKLLNAIQLKNLDRTNALIAASIEQRTGQLGSFRFKEAVTYQENKPLLKYIALPAFIALLIVLVYPAIFVQGTERIINYKRHYEPLAPFRFEVLNNPLQTFRGEDFELKVDITGKAIPNEVFINYNGRRQKLNATANGTYTYTFKQLQKPVTFQLEGSGFMSDGYTVALLTRPNLRDFQMLVQYPAYLKRKPDVIQNTGNASVPEGSTITWEFSANETDRIELSFEDPHQVLAAENTEDNFSASKLFNDSRSYSINLHNRYSTNKEQISYEITTIADHNPQISVEQYQDTALYTYMVLGGDVSDDHGLTRLDLVYRILNENNPQANYKSVRLPLNPQQLSQTYYHQWNTAPLNLKPGDKLEYFVQVWDNDALHGPKSARTRTFEMKIPDKRELQKSLDSNSQSVASQMSETLNKATKLQEELARSEEKMKTKRNLDWQDKKQLENLMAKKKQLEQDISSMKELFDQLNKKQNMLSEQDKQLAQKAQELQKLMDELLDPETKKLYEELEKLLQQQQPNDTELQKLLSKLDNKERNLERELERALELFKQLQFEQKLDNLANKLEEMAQTQEQLAQKTEQKQEDNQKLQEDQKELQEEFEEVKEQMQDLKELNDKLENPTPMDEKQQQQDQQSIEQDMQQSQQQLKKQENKKASESQQKAGQKMEQMAKQMEQMSSSMNMEGMSQNLDNLRDILENLIKLSFDQEELMKQFRGVNQSDPRFITLSERQLSLQDNAQVIEDSLFALAKKVFQIESFVTREVAAMNQSMDNSIQELRDRNVGKATAQQQMAMTSMNNLALMLNDALKQMQQAMQQMGSMAGKQKGNKPKPGDLGDLQQELNKKIDELKKGGKTGKALSQELAKLAAEQEALRNALKELEKQGKKPGDKGQNGELGNISKMMEQSEIDLVNKRLTEQTILRQREILTRLLEAEQSAKERELDNKREAKSAQDIARKVPPSFEKYVKAKEKQTELLKTIPPALTPYYKQKVNEYFQNISK
ncbi:coiled-coil domain-containing protein [Pontibacter sp. CAU 1760]